MQGLGPVSRETELIDLVDQAISRAAYLLDMADIPDGSDDDFYMLVHEERYHCGVCTVNTVMGAVWPALYAYIQHVRCPGFGPFPFDP